MGNHARTRYVVSIAAPSFLTLFGPNYMQILSYNTPGPNPGTEYVHGITEPQGWHAKTLSGKELIITPDGDGGGTEARVR